MGGVLKRFSLACSVVVVFALPGSAWAEGGKPPDVSAVLQYVEMVPTATGSSPVGGRQRHHAARLSQSASRALKVLPTPQRKALHEIATSAAAGAPTLPSASAPRHRPTRGASQAGRVESMSVSAALGSVRDVTAVGGGVGLTLPVALAVVTLGIAAAALMRARAGG